jgi:hypothetical protein
MNEHLHKLLRLSEGASTHDGSRVKVKIETETADPLVIEMESESIADIIQYLSHLAIDAAQKRGDDMPIAERLPRFFAPMPASDIGLALGNMPGNVILVVRVGGLDFGFEYPSDKLKQSLSSPAFAQSIDLLGASPKSSH